MRISQSIKPISYLKAHAEEMIGTLDETRGVYIITKNGEAKAVLQDIKTYEEVDEAITFLQIMALSEESYRQGKFKPLKEAFADIRKKIKELQKSEIKTICEPTHINKKRNFTCKPCKTKCKIRLCLSAVKM